MLDRTPYSHRGEQGFADSTASHSKKPFSEDPGPCGASVVSTKYKLGVLLDHPQRDRGRKPGLHALRGAYFFLQIGLFATFMETKDG